LNAFKWARTSTLSALIHGYQGSHLNAFKWPPVSGLNTQCLQEEVLCHPRNKKAPERGLFTIRVDSPESAKLTKKSQIKVSYLGSLGQ